MWMSLRYRQLGLATTSAVTHPQSGNVCRSTTGELSPRRGVVPLQGRTVKLLLSERTGRRSEKSDDAVQRRLMAAGLGAAHTGAAVLATARPEGSGVHVPQRR